jgi:hypothetical protein
MWNEIFPENEESEEFRGAPIGFTSRLEDAKDPGLFYALELIQFNLRQMEAFALPTKKHSQAFLDRGALNRVYLEESAAFFFTENGMEMLVSRLGVMEKIPISHIRKRVRPLYRQALRNLSEYEKRHAKLWLEKRLARAEGRRLKRPKTEKMSCTS